MRAGRFNAERACVRERVHATREKEGNKQLGDEKGARREGRKERPRKRVSLTNATWARGRRVIITHLSPVGSESPWNRPVGPRWAPRVAHRQPAAPRRGSASFSHLLRLWLRQRDCFFYTLMILTDYVCTCVYLCVYVRVYIL